jgi:ADP-heptose:LPS heptosyltransferase
MATPAFSVLYISSSRIGDAVLASGIVKRLYDQHPNARFTIVAGPPSAPLFADTPGLEQIIVMRKSRGGGHWLRLWNEVRARRWSLIVDRRGSSIARVLLADQRAIHHSLPGEPVHKVVEAARLLGQAHDPPAPYLFTSAATQGRADALLASGSGPILALAPAANWVGKTWPAERFAALARTMIASGQPFEQGRVLVLGGPDDRAAAHVVRAAVPPDRCIDLTGQVDPLTAHACLKRARLFVGNDSGLMHLAAAAGAPTVGLFGPSDDRLYAPWGRHTRVVRGPRGVEALKAVDPDFSLPVCHMLDLPLERVADAVRALMAETAT